MKGVPLNSSRFSEVGKGYGRSTNDIYGEIVHRLTVYFICELLNILLKYVDDTQQP